MSSNKKPEEDDEGGGSSSGGARASPPPRAPVRQSHPTTPSSRPQTAPNQGSSKGTGRGSGFFSQSSLTMLLLLALRMPNLATTGTWSNPFETRMLNLRPLTDPESDEACLTMMSTNPLNLSPTMSGLFTEHPDPKGVVGELTHPVAHEEPLQIMLIMVLYFLLFLGQGISNTQATFTCLLFMSQPVLASQEDGNTRPGFVVLLSLILASLLLYWGGASNSSIL